MKINISSNDLKIFNFLSEVLASILLFVLIERTLYCIGGDFLKFSPYSNSRFIIFMIVTVLNGVWWHLIFYRENQLIPFWEFVYRSLSGILLMLGIDTFLLFILHEPQSRSHWFLTWITILTFIPLLRYYQRNLLISHQQVNDIFYVGSGAQLVEVLKALSEDRNLGYQAKKIYSIKEPDIALKEYCGYRNIEISTESIYSINHITPTSRIVLALNKEDIHQIDDLVKYFQRWTKNIVIAPSLSTLHGMFSRDHFILGYDLILEENENHLALPLSKVIKRIFDVLLALMLILVFMPLILLVAIAIWLSGGPAFFSQERIGYAGRPFVCWKFRTMVLDSEQIFIEAMKDEAIRLHWEIYQKIPNDPRVTRIGKWLRRTSFDELPQLWNVLKGDMSLVGPRPILAREIIYWRDALEYYLLTKPGITGLWQVSGRNHLNYDKRIALDTWYIKNWTLWLDFVILLKTIRVVFRSDGAY